MVFHRFSIVFSLCLMMVCPLMADDDWSRFRGPGGRGIAKSSKVVNAWSESTNVQWTMDLPGPGSSCPIVFGDNVYLTCYTGYGVESGQGQPKDLKRHLICVDRKSGKQVWRSTIDSAADEDPYTGFIVEHGYASSTPATDGKHLFTFFSKSGVCAFDMKGKKVWQNQCRNPIGPQ